MSLGALASMNINVGTANSQVLAFNATGGANARTSAAMIKGVYYLTATVAALVRLGSSSVDATTAWPTSQNGNASAACYLPANVPVAVALDGTQYVAAIAVGAGAGNLYIAGPIGKSSVR